MSKAKKISETSRKNTTKDSKWVSSAAGQKHLSSFIGKAEKLAASISESRIISDSVVKEPFTL